MSTTLITIIMIQETEYKEKLIIGHWNCRSTKNKKILLENFIIKNQYDVFCQNETILKENQTLDLQNFNFIGKNRKEPGECVGFLVRKEIDYEITDSFIKFNREIVSIKLKLTNSILNVISWYLPPDKKANKNENSLNEELFIELSKNKPFVLCGDLSCHSSKWFCTNTLPKGKQLADLIEKFDFNILNPYCSTITYTQSNNVSVIDLVIISNDLSDKFNNLKVFRDNLTSDHFPLKINFN